MGLLCPWDFPARVLDWVAISSSGGSSDPGIEPGSPALQADALPSKPPGKPCVAYWDWVNFCPNDVGRNMVL